MNDEIKETAKATQEIAKAATTAIEATEKLGKFVGNLVSEPLEEIIGILADKLKFIRWERQVRFSEKCKELIEKRGLSKFRVIPPKFALPLIENASLEENDELQDLWAKLLFTSIDPIKEFPRQGYIDILKQLEVIDVKVLKIIYEEYMEIPHQSLSSDSIFTTPEDPTYHPIFYHKIFNKINIENKIYFSVIDNLMRMRLVTYHVHSGNIEIQEGFNRFSSIGGYKIISITSLGVEFVEACIKE